MSVPSSAMVEPRFDGTRYSVEEIFSLLDVPLMPNTVPEWFLARAEASTSSSRAKAVPTEDAVTVHARVRPLLARESQAGIGILAGMAQTCSEPTNNSAVALTADSGDIGGFASVLGPSASNEAVFQRTLMPRLATVLHGGTACLFSYGYTGSGKTHTVLGYDSEAGLFELSAKELLALLQADSPGLYLSASVMELYGETVYDLCGDNKVECTLNKDEAGQLQVRGPAETCDLVRLVPELKVAEVVVDNDVRLPQWVRTLYGDGVHSTRVVEAPGLRTMAVQTHDDVKHVTQSSVRMRAVGSSSEHKQSSRSHAVLTMEVVNDEFVAAQKRVEQAQSLIAPIRNAVDNLMHYYFTSLIDFNDLSENNRHPLRVYEDPDEWHRRKAMILAIKGTVDKRLEEAYVAAAAAQDSLAALQHAQPLLGGRLVLCDLAGADYDDRDVGKDTHSAELKESANINKSLLALKNCLRSISAVPGAPTRPPFRDSTLTRILETALQPRGGARESVSVMLLNVSPADHIERMTINTLRYGQILASRGASKKKTSQVQSRASPQVCRAPQRCKFLQPCDPTIHEELLRIYHQHCPEKSEQEVQVILSRFAGREAELLQKVRDKYVHAAQ